MENYTEIPEEILEREAAQTESLATSDSSKNTSMQLEQSDYLFLITSIMLVVLLTALALKFVGNKGRKAKSKQVLKQEYMRKEQKEKEKQERAQRKADENRVKRPSGIPETKAESREKSKKHKSSKKPMHITEIKDSFETNLLDDAVLTDIDDAVFGIGADDFYEENKNDVDSFFEEVVEDVNKEADEDIFFVTDELPPEESPVAEPEEPVVAREEPILKEEPTVVEEPTVAEEPVVEFVEDSENAEEVTEEKSSSDHVVSYVDDYVTNSAPIMEEAKEVLSDVEEGLGTLKGCRGISTIVNRVRVNDAEEDLPVEVLKGSKVTVTFRTKFDFDFDADVEVDKINCEALEIQSKLVFDDGGNKKMVQLTFNAPEDMRVADIHAKIENDMTGMSTGKVKLITHLVIAV